MKKIIVFGASGGTGKHFVEQALKAGYFVTVVIRNPIGFALNHENLKIVKGDVLVSPDYCDELKGQDVVVSCLGIPKIQTTKLYSTGMANITRCMEKSGLTRIICISSGALDIPPNSSFIMNFLLKYVLQKIYKPIYKDMRVMEDLLKNSGLEYTIVRAPKLTDGKATGKYKDITGQPLRGIPAISRADLAAFMLTHIKDEKTFNKTIDIAY